MGLSLGALVYSITMNNSRLKANVDESKRKIKSMNKEVKNQKKVFEKNYGEISDIVKTAGFALTTFAGIVGMAGFKLAKIAGQAEDTQQKFGVVFQGMESQANSFVKNFSDKFDIADSSIQEWMATLKDTFDPLGVANKQSLEWSKTLTALALDAETFYPSINSANDAIGRFTSYLVGNHEAVREMGVVVNEAMIKTKAYEMGIADAGSELTELQKMTARYELLLNGLENAQGNATRELDNFNMALTQVKEVGKETAEIYGEDLKPTFARILNIIKEVLKFFRDLPSPIRKSISQLTIFSGIFAGVTGPMLLIIGYLPHISSGLKLISIAANGASISFTPFLVGGAIILGLTTIYNYLVDIRDEMTGLNVDISAMNLDQAESELEKTQKRIKEMEKQFSKDGVDLDVYNRKSVFEKFGFSKYNSLPPMMQGIIREYYEQLDKAEELQQKIIKLKKQQENLDDSSNKSNSKKNSSTKSSYYEKELSKLQKEMDMQGVALEEQISRYQEIRNKLESAKRQIISDAVPEEFKKKITAELKMSGDDIDSALSETEVKLYQLIEQQAIETYDNLMKKDKEQLKYKKININTALEDYKRMYKKIENDDRLSLDTRKQLMERYDSEIKRLKYQRDAEISSLDQQLLDNQKRLIDDGLNVRLMSIEEEREAVKASYTEQIQDQNKLKKKLEEVDELYDKLRDNALKDYDDDNTTYGDLNDLGKLLYNITDDAEKAKTASENFTNSLVSGLTDAIATGESLRDVFKNILIELQKMIVKKNIVEPLLSGITSFLGFDIGIDGTAHTGGYIAANGIEQFHTGGVVGLKPSERIIKAKVGEMVLTEQHQENLTNNMRSQQSSQPTPTIINQITAMDSQDVMRALTRDGGKAVAQALGMDLKKNGASRTVIKNYIK